MILRTNIIIVVYIIYNAYIYTYVMENNNGVYMYVYIYIYIHNMCFSYRMVVYRRTDMLTQSEMRIRTQASHG